MTRLMIHTPVLNSKVRRQEHSHHLDHWSRCTPLHTSPHTAGHWKVAMGGRGTGEICYKGYICLLTYASIENIVDLVR
jgi:hypothetical protein